MTDRHDHQSQSRSRRCCACGRILTNPRSIAAGIGPVCHQRRAMADGRKPVTRPEPPVQMILEDTP